ncbi:conserved membrane hypothetical protein [uncultured delta proteobacterium]|uniref:EamA domain-containing protein n=1 Tax=uncultured delta proteobacterium TaxID=34034 RepID=A0A212K2Y7_9DELT|nr:conserved membrane hypothetical protein [uncultured delta proteobacterium]
MEQKPFLLLTPGEWALVGVTIIWGTTFLIIRNALSSGGPLFFVGLRFTCAALVMVAVSIPVLRGLTFREVVAGSLIGLGLFTGYALQSSGLQWITASKSAFITAFYVPAVPLLQWLIMRRPPGRNAWLGVAMAFIGVALLAGPDGVSLGFGKGEAYTFLGAVAVAVEIVLIGFFANSVDVRRVTIVQVAVCAVLAFCLMPVAGEALPPFSWAFTLSACGLGVATALIQSVMNWAQKSISPTRATVIYAGEPVWAGIFGRMFGERLPALAFLGGALIVLSVIVSGLRAGKKKR